MEHSCEKLMDYAKREERERILGIIEYYMTELSDETVAERLAKRMLRQCVKTVERQEREKEQPAEPKENPTD